MFANLSERSKIMLQVVFVLAVVGGAIGIMVSMSGLRPSQGSHRVRFEVDATGGFALITLDAGKVTIKDPEQVSVPWSQTIKIEPGTEVYFTAANPSATGKITCTILLDQVVWKTETTNAPKNGVACAGIVP